MFEISSKELSIKESVLSSYFFVEDLKARIEDPALYKDTFQNKKTVDFWLSSWTDLISISTMDQQVEAKFIWFMRSLLIYTGNGGNWKTTLKPYLDSYGGFPSLNIKAITLVKQEHASGFVFLPDMLIYYKQNTGEIFDIFSRIQPQVIERIKGGNT